MQHVATDEEINTCQSSEAKLLGLQIKELEALLNTRFKGVQLERFVSAQAAWRQMVEKDCEIQADFYEGAPIYIAVQAQCLQHHYRSRLEVLGRYLCPEHSLAKGCQKPGAPPNEVRPQQPVEIPVSAPQKAGGGNQ